MSDAARQARWEPVCVTACAALAALAVWIAGWRFGAAVSPDSTIYLSAAENLARGRGLVTFDGEPLVRWAPLYPALLALGIKIGLGALATARWIGTLGMGGLVVLSAAWLRRHVSSPAVRMFALVGVASATALLRDALFIWSEFPFLLFLVACLMDLEKYAERPERGILLRAARWASLAALDRYVGVTAGIVGVWIALRPRRFLDAVLFALVALGPLALWLAHNVAISGSAMGESAPAAEMPWLIARDTLDVLSKEWLPGAVPFLARGIAVLGGGALLVAALARTKGTPTAPDAAWLVLYIVTLIAGASRSSVEPINQRYLSPALVPIIVLGTRGLEPFVHGAGWRRGVALVLALGWLAYSAGRAGWHLESYFRTGYESYTAPSWRQSALAAALRADTQSDTLYSNAPDAVYFLSGRPAKLSPRRTYYGTNIPVAEDLPRLEGEVVRHPVRLAWFGDLERTFLYSPSDLGSQLEATYADGALYRLEKK